MSLKTFNIIVEQGVDGYLISSVIELPRCHTQGKSLDELYQRTKEAIEVYLDDNKNKNSVYLSQTTGTSYFSNI
jgi:predicted RNase H-like HicB family nuclease